MSPSKAYFYNELRGEVAPCSQPCIFSDDCAARRTIAVVNFVKENNLEHQGNLLSRLSIPQFVDVYILLIGSSYDNHGIPSNNTKASEEGCSTKIWQSDVSTKMILQYDSVCRIRIACNTSNANETSEESNNKLHQIVETIEHTIGGVKAEIRHYIMKSKVSESQVESIRKWNRSKSKEEEYAFIQKSPLSDHFNLKGFVISLTPVMKSNMFSGTRLSRLQMTTPLLSISLEKISGRDFLSSETDEISKEKASQADILLQLCIKRLLIGRIVVCPVDDDDDSQERTITKIRVPSIEKDGEEVFEYKVKTILPYITSSTRNSSLKASKTVSSKIFLVLPSTRITLTSPIEERVVKQTLNTNSKENVQHGTEDLLLETIAAVRHCSLTNAKSVKKSNYFIDVPRAYLLSGPAGVGKTYSVNMAVQATNAQVGSDLTKLISLRGSEILSAGANESEAALELKRTILSAVEFASKSDLNISVIFMDECDALLSSSTAGGLLAHLLDKISSHSSDFDKISKGWKKVIVIAATNRVDAIPESLRRPGRFDRELVISPPNKEQRFDILLSLIRDLDQKNEYNISKASLQDVADLCVGYVAADLSSLVRQAAYLSMTNGQHIITPELLKAAMTEVGASALRDSSVNAPPSTRWSDIAGDVGGAKAALRRAVEWPRTKKKEFEMLGLKAPRGILLHGPPGCGKTSLARAAAGSAGVAFLSLSPADVYASSYVGEAEAVIRRAFSLARAASPCILFFDEIDSIVSTSSTNKTGMDRGNNAEARVLSTFLNEMDGVDGSINDGVMVLGATNRPGTIDSALLRPGRFDSVVYVPNPNEDGRRSIFNAKRESWSNSGGRSDIDIDILSSEAVSGYMTGAEIVGACTEAAMNAIREALDSGNTDVPIVEQRHLESSLAAVKPLLSDPKILSEYTIFEEEHSK